MSDVYSKNNKISFITFTRNSGRRLRLLLENVRDVVDEIIVVDGFSVDDTVEIARSYGAKVFQRKPWGYADPDRMFALSKASYDWILYLDDDELLGRKLKNDLRDLIEKADKEMIDAFSIVRVNYDLKCRQIIFGPAYPDRQIRIYRKDKVLYRGIVHEHPIVYGSVKELSNDYYIIHYGSLSRYKLVFYAYLESIEYFEHQARVRKPLWKLSPFSASLLTLYIILKEILLKHNPSLNICTIIRTIDLFSYYEILVHTLIRFRGRKRTKLSKIISEHGLIKLLEHSSL